MITLIMFLAILFGSGCGEKHKEHSDSNGRSDPSTINPYQASYGTVGVDQPLKMSKEEVENHPPKIDAAIFSLDFGGLHFKAERDVDGFASILNYPTEWRGRARIVRFDGDSADPPFSKEHCETIRAMNRFGGSAMTRIAFHSVVKFEVPPFLSAGFLPAVMDAARQAGEYRPIFSLKNVVHRSNGKLDVKFAGNSITPLAGNLNGIYDQINLALFPGEDDDLHYKVIIKSGDILCDLASGAATLAISFPIEGEEKFIRVTYDKFEVKL